VKYQTPDCSFFFCIMLSSRSVRAFPSLNQVVRRFAGVRSKAAEVDDAVYRIPDNATITVGGFVAQSCAEYVLEAVGRRFEETGSPSNLTLVFGGGPGDYATKGLNHFAQPGMLKRTIGSHYGQTPMLAEMALANEIEAYYVPMGSISRMVRSAASKSPGHVTTVGFGTMVDPALGGGKLNAKTTEDLIEVVEILGKRYLLYKAIPIDVAIVRGTTGDDGGNITMEHESLLCDHMIQAMAARSTRGLVIAEVEHIVSEQSLRARDVKIPGTMVDCVVARPLEYQKMSFFTASNETWIGNNHGDDTHDKTIPFSLGSRKIIARRAAMEIQPNQVINLGIGMPEGVALVAEEESILPFIELTTEPGVHGGVGATGHDFGPGAYPHAFLEMHQQFDFYNGGGLDVCFLGNAETDAQGNVVSSFSHEASLPLH
jgi:propionate CoA-transferase